MFLEKEGKVQNDHIAFRTFNDPRINIDVLSSIFVQAGYEPKGNYEFPEKRLNARHFEHKGHPLEAPLVFISELKLELFSDFLQGFVNDLLDSIPESRYESKELIYDGTFFGSPSYEKYQKLLKESEYAAWLYINGFRANHFTVRVNGNKHLDSIEKVNAFLKAHGFRINGSGGEIKGSPEILLEQSSIMADKINITFDEGDYQVPGCYYEFAKRYKDKSGKLFTGFVAKSADKIFESTDNKE